VAVQVHVPVRIRLDARSITERPDEVGDALGLALARALQRSRREVVEPRGGYLQVRTREPVVTWTGAAVQSVADGDRRAFADRVRQVVADAVAGADLDPGLPAGVALPLTEPAGEVRDPFRHRALLRTYRVPSYGDDGAPTEITFDAEVIRPDFAHDWSVRPVADLRDHLMDIVREAVRQHGPLSPATPRGLIAKVIDTSGSPAWVVIVTTTPLSHFRFEAFGEMVLVPGPPAHFVPHHRDPTAAPGTVDRRLVTDRAGLAASIADLMGPDIRARIQAAEPRGETTSSAEYDARLDAAVDAEVGHRADAAMASLHGATLSSLVVVRIGGSFVLLVGTAASDVDLHWTGTANLLPVTTERLRGGDPEGDGSGGGGAGGDGAGGDGGTGEHGGGTGGEAGGTGTGTGTGRGAFVFDPTAPTPPPVPPGAERNRFVSVPGGTAKGRTCASFNGEPSLEELGADGEPLRLAMDDIAYRLQMGPACHYPANFCLQAAEALASRAALISAYITSSEREGFTRPTPQGGGGLGPLDFRPAASPAIQFLRHLAGVVPRLHRLGLAVMRTYERPENWAKVHGGWIDSTASWDLHFLREFTPAVEDAVGRIFLSANQAMMMQLLLTSQQGIEARIRNFAQYAPIFERLLVSQLTDYAELQGLRSRLRAHDAAAWTQRATGAGDGALATASTLHPATAWFGAARSLSGAFLTTEAAFTTVGGAGEIVTTAGVTRIRDSRGVMWTEADIEQALVMQRGEAEGIDPLVKQIADLPDVLHRFAAGDRAAIRTELARVLREMSANNTEMLGKVRSSATFAFRASRISDHIPSATVSGSRYALQGIHLVTHGQIGEFFAGDTFYALGIDALFNAELGREELMGFGITVGIVLLSVLCPPLGFVVGVAVAVHDVRHARERERLYGALIDPELVLTRAEVEVELFAAYLGLAMSLVPEAGTIGGAVMRGGRVALRSGMRAGLRVARGFVVRRVTRQIVEAASRDLLQAFVTEILINEVMEKIIQKVMEPILAHIEREAQLTGAVGGREGARFILMVQAQRTATTTTSGGTP
jgi:hypothetical protein